MLVGEMGKGRTPCCEKGRVKKGPWSQDEDLKLISFIQRHGHSNWRSLPKLAGLARCGKSCRLRWVNYLRPDVKRGSLSPDEEQTIITLQSLLGNKWSKIASHLPGRTDNEIKNIWNTHLKKRSTSHRKPEIKSTHQDPDKTISYEPSTRHGHVQGLPPSTSHNEEGVCEEPNLVALWESLLLDDHPSYGDCEWAVGASDGSEPTETARVGYEASQEAVDGQVTRPSGQVEESYLEIMAWPSSPASYTFSGF